MRSTENRAFRLRSWQWAKKKRSILFRPSAFCSTCLEIILITGFHLLPSAFFIGLFLAGSEIESYAIFIVAFLLRSLFTFGLQAILSNYSLANEFFPLEARRFDREATICLLWGSPSLLIEGAVFASATPLDSWLQIALASLLYFGVIVSLLFYSARRYRVKGDVGFHIKEESGAPRWKESLEKLIGLKSQISWFDHFYHRILTSSETHAAKSIFPQDYKSPSAKLLSGTLGIILSLMAVGWIVSNYTIFEIYKGWSAYFLLAAFFLWFFSNSITVFPQKKTHTLSTVPVPYRDAAFAHLKLALSRRLLGWLPAYSISLCLSAIFFSPSYCQFLYSFTLIYLISIPAIESLYTEGRVVPARGFRDTILPRWLKALSSLSLLALFCIPSLLLISCPFYYKEHANTLYLIAGVNSCFGCLNAALHYLGWKRSWYDV